jgi:hypothetical protein
MPKITVTQPDPKFVVELDYNHATSLLETLNGFEWTDMNGFDLNTRKCLSDAVGAVSTSEELTFSEDPEWED